MRHIGFNRLYFTGFVLAAITMVAPVAGCGASDEDRTETTTSDESVYNPADRGREIYATYCQGCHGPEGRGNGPVAPMLSVELSDLTLLVEKYGQFPEELIRATIDGRAEVESHGTREMPVWGNIWNDPSDPVAEERIRQQIGELVDFIESIQRSAE